MLYYVIYCLKCTLPCIAVECGCDCVCVMYAVKRTVHCVSTCHVGSVLARQWHYEARRTIEFSGRHKPLSA
jgi:hypothetical protein